jgi:integrase
MLTETTPVSVRDALQAHVQTRPQARRTTRESYKLWLVFCDEVGVTQVEQITPALWYEWQARRLEGGGAPGTINTYHKVVAQVLSTAVQFGSLPKNPLDGVKYLRDRGVRIKGSLSVDECKALIATSEPCHALAWAAYILTGMRHRELALRPWRDFDANRGLIHLPAEATKTDTARIVILGKGLQARLAEAWAKAGRNPSLPICASPQGRFRKNNLLRTFFGAIERAGIARVREDDRGRQLYINIHALRVTFATLLVDVIGAPEGIVAYMLGHEGGSLLRTTYHVPDVEVVRGWAQKLEDLILG